VWQALRAQLHPQGLEVVTVAMESLGVEEARPYIDMASAEHPSLIDAGHLMGERFGVVNIPSGVWIDERGVIVRPAEPAWAAGLWRTAMTAGLDEAPERLQKLVGRALAEEIDPEGYVAALRDWVAKGPDSEWALTPDEVVARSAPRSAEQARAAAHFELAQQLHRAGSTTAAVEHFRQAHRLQPENWTYKRQAWSLTGPEGPMRRFWQGPLEGEEWPYEGEYASEVLATPLGHYYPPMERSAK
jgi:hypothetical protein